MERAFIKLTTDSREEAWVRADLVVYIAADGNLTHVGMWGSQDVGVVKETPAEILGLLGRASRGTS